MSAVTDRLTEENFRELARIIRSAHARRAARLERERLERDREDEPRDGDGDHHALTRRAGDAEEAGSSPSPEPAPTGHRNRNLDAAGPKLVPFSIDGPRDNGRPCGHPVHEPASRGRRRFCSDLCRVRGQRAERVYDEKRSARVSSA